MIKLMEILRGGRQSLMMKGMTGKSLGHLNLGQPDEIEAAIELNDFEDPDDLKGIDEENVNEGIGSNLVKTMTGEYNGKTKRNKLSKLGLNSHEVVQLEKRYIKTYLNVAKKLGAKVLKMPDNFGGVSVSLQDKTEKFMNALKKELSKFKVKEENVNELHFTGDILNKVRADIFDFLSSEHKKLGYPNPLDTYHLIQQVMNSSKIQTKAKGMR